MMPVIVALRRLLREEYRGSVLVLGGEVEVAFLLLDLGWCAVSQNGGEFW